MAAGLLAGCRSAPSSRAPGYDPPPAEARRLSRDEVWTLASRGALADAIAELDRYPFAFELEPELTWFEARGLRPGALDYLRKRARVDWESLRGDVDPDFGAEPEPAGSTSSR